MKAYRIAAVVRKETRDYRRNRLVVTTMAVLPVIFLISPMITLLRIPGSATGSVAERAVGVTSLLLLVVPLVVPSVVTAYSVVGEREQGTLEPFLTTPIRADELLLGKAVAAFVPSVALAYALYGIVLGSVSLGAAHVVEVTLLKTPQVLAQVLFTPLLAAWAIWVGIAMSVRASDVRVAQQLATLASLPALGFVSLISFQVITPSVGLAVGLALVVLVVDVLAWRLVSHLFDSERLTTGSAPLRDEPAAGSAAAGS
jgi:ABC-2 type transport system permease protein